MRTPRNEDDWDLWCGHLGLTLIRIKILVVDSVLIIADHPL